MDNYNNQYHLSCPNHKKTCLNVIMVAPVYNNNSETMRKSNNELIREKQHTQQDGKCANPLKSRL